MSRMVRTREFTIALGQSVSNELAQELRDAYQFVVGPPATLPEADIALQFFLGGNWVFYDNTNFVAGIDNYKEFVARGTKYRLIKRAGSVAADRVFGVNKRVAGTG